MHSKIYYLFLIYIPLLISCKQIPTSDTEKLKYMHLLSTQPEQQEINITSVTLNNTSIELVAKYKIAALVLGKENYYFGDQASLVPVDLALGWGVMSDKSLLSKAKVDISQGGRFYRWYVPSFDTLSRADIAFHSANTHIIPATSEIKNYISHSVSKDDYIYMEGYLVNFKLNNQSFNTSLTRNDVDAGACEIFLVTSIKHIF